ncbi:MAG TPA: CusA/CzcA family heavy metal efflux RND transporter [Xanthobacteraceae bacterium]|jgi:cobalt-zinc-cadmium resistance protein CzcA
MINQFVALCFRKRLVVRLLAIFAAVFGIYAWTQLAIDAYPLLSPVSAQVTVQVPGLAAEEVEQQITIPLERALNGTPGLTNMRSISTFALSQINLLFRDGAEDYWERQRVRERIGDVTLPAGASPGLDSVTAPELEIYRYTIESDTKNLMDLSEYQRWVIQPALRQVPGVAEVDNFGGFTRQFRLDLDPTELLRYGLGINDVINAINNNSANAGGGRVPRGDQSLIVRGVGLVRTLDDLGNIVVTQRNSMPILVRDLGKLSYTHQEPEGILGLNENPATIEGIVMGLKYSNVSQVIDGIHAKVAELQKQLDSEDVHIVPVLDRGDLVAATVSKIGHTVLEGIGLVIVVLWLFLGSPRSALVVAVTIPLAVVSIFVLMNAAHMSASMLSLGALDFGVIVDGAIVVTENILRRRESKPTETLTEEDVRSATSQVARPIFFATLIIITAYFPLFTLQRGEAALFTPMAFTVAFALFGALLCTLALVPGLAYLAFRKPRQLFRNIPLERLGHAYRAALGRLLNRPALSYIAAALAFVGVAVLGTNVGRDYLPDLDEGSLWLQVQLPSGLSLDAASEMASELRRAVREFPEVRYIMTQLGREDEAVDAWTPSHIEAPIGLTPYETWPKGETKADFVRKLNARLHQLPGFDVGINQPISDMVFDLVGGAHSALVIRLFGDDFAEDRRIAGEIVDLLRNIRGTAEASIFQEPPLPQMVIEADRAAAARYGINVSDITNLIQTGVGGAAVTQVYVGDRVYDVTVRFPLDARNNPEALGNLSVTSSSGMQIPLSQLVTIKQRNGEGTITRTNNRRNLSIRIDLTGRDLASYLDEVQQRIAESVQFDRSKYQLDYAGQFENQERAQRRFTLILGLVLGVMLLLLYAEFGRLRQSLLILGIVPLAALGGLTALFVTGETLNVATAVGFIALFGVAVQNGIIMVANLNRVRETGVSLRDAVVIGASERFRPVLMTATVATIGMLPAAIATGVGSDVQRGVATVVIGGLIFATMLTLFIVPSLYYSLERIAERWAPSRDPLSAPNPSM